VDPENNPKLRVSVQLILRITSKVRVLVQLIVRITLKL